MDFADDFTYFSLNDVIAELKRLYGHNKYIQEIRLTRANNDEPAIEFRVRSRAPRRAGSLGLPAQFRRIKTHIVAVHEEK